MSDDAELVRRFRRGDPGAAWTLLERYGPDMLAVARSVTGDTDAAEDALQEALLRVLHRGDRFRGGSLRAWLRSVVMRVALNAKRGEQRTIARGAAYAIERSDTEVTRADPLLRDALRREIERLPDEERIVFRLIELEGWTHGEAGAALGITPETSRQRLFQARKRLRTALAPLRNEHR